MNRHGDAKCVVQISSLRYLESVVATLLSSSATRFDLGSGTPTPHTSTTPHSIVVVLGGLTSLIGKLHYRDLYVVAIAHVSLRFATA